MRKYRSFPTAWRTGDDACGRRVAKLYGPGRYFVCRHCYRLAYASQSEDAQRRSMRRASKIRQRLVGNAGNTLTEVVTTLDREGYSTNQIQGPLLKRQLTGLIKAARPQPLDRDLSRGVQGNRATAGP